MVVAYLCGPVHFFIALCQLLMASGIGDKAELQAHGVECIADISELGKNLQVRYRTNLSAPSMFN